MSGEAGKWAGRGALLGRASAGSGGALGRAGTATRERGWAEAEEGEREGSGPREKVCWAEKRNEDGGGPDAWDRVQGKGSWARPPG